jgi:tRNA(Ile)-lysidine synthase
VTVDHGLRPESAAEARAVKRLAGRLGVPHRTLRWTGKKPRTGLQRAAREARYRLLAAAACAAKADHVLTAHTLDDQAETLLIRMSRGSGIGGLAGIRKVSALPLPNASGAGMLLVRPLLDIPKARLVATLRHARIAFAEDASNRDPRFARARLRNVMPALAREGLDAARLALLARRIQRAEAALEYCVDAAASELSAQPWAQDAPLALDAEKFFALPAEIALRLLGRAIACVGDEGPVELAKLEALHAALGPAGTGLRRTLAGALVSLSTQAVVVERAPQRRSRRV